MATVVKDLGAVTAYAYAVAGGYSGTEEEFEALLGNIAEDLSEIENLSVTVTTLPAGSAATASYSNGVLSLGIPKGDKGDKGNTGATGATGPTGNGISTITKTGTSGLVDTYTITFTNGNTTTFTVTNGEDGEVTTAQMNAAIATALEDYAKVDGSYSSLTAGNAEQLVSTVGIEDKVPYSFRTSGGSADIGDRETDMVVGGTVAWNQLVKNGNFDGTNNWAGATQVSAISASDNVLEVNAKQATDNTYVDQRGLSFNQGHKYLINFNIKTDSLTNTKYFYFGTYPTALPVYQGGLNSTSAEWKPVKTILSCTSTSVSRIRVGERDTAPSGVWTYYLRDIIVLDLTQMFGSTIADYIYGLEQANAGAGVAWFRKLFPKPYYAYDAGSLQSVNTSAHKMVGFNAYNNTTGKAKLVGGMQYQITGTYSALSYSTGETLTPDADGYFTPTENGEMTITGGNATDTCVHLVWDGEKDGQFEPYEVNSYALDSSLTLRGIPKLDSDNKLYYDGDTYESDGTVTRKYGERAYTSGDESLADAITDGTTTVYKLATPTTETADPYQNPQIVNDFGTEEYVDAGVTAATPTRDVEIPVGHQTFYQANLRAKLEMAPDSPSGDGDYIVRQTDGENTYVPLVIPTELPTNPSENGTYSLKVTVADGVATMSWVADS